MLPGLGFWAAAAPPPEPAISLSPSNPGTLTESSPGAGADWDTTVLTNFSGSFSWVVREGVRPHYPWRTGATVVTPDASGSTPITAHFVASGDFVHAWKSDDAGVAAFSGGITLA